MATLNTMAHPLSLMLMVAEVPVGGQTELGVGRAGQGGEAEFSAEKAELGVGREGQRGAERGGQEGMMVAVWG